jgi:hypothetical protein
MEWIGLEWHAIWILPVDCIFVIAYCLLPKFGSFPEIPEGQGTLSL